MMMNKSLGIVALALVSAYAGAQEVLFHENFENNNFNQWFSVNTSTVLPTIVSTPVYEGQLSSNYPNVGLSGTLGRYAAPLSRETTPDDVLVLSYYYYDDIPNPGTFPIGRHYTELRDYTTPSTSSALGTGLSQLLAIGISSNDGATTQVGQVQNGAWVGVGQSTGRYRGRLLSVAAGSGVPGFSGAANNNAPDWMAFGQTDIGAADNTQNRRSNGWHRMTIVHSDTTAQYIVDNWMGFFWNHNRPATIDTIIHGSGLSSTAAAAYYDQFVVRAFPHRSINVQVKLEDYVGDATQVPVNIDLIDSSSNVTSSSGFIDAYGTVTVQAPADGNYTVVVKGSHWLARSTGELVVTEIGVHNAAVSLMNGDVDGDNEVAPNDFSLLSASFGLVLGDPGYNPAADLDGDEEVGPSDFSILATNFGQIGD